VRIVIWGSTHYEICLCKKTNKDGSESMINPSSAQAFLETYSETPVQVASLSCSKIATGEYVVRFFADKTIYKTKTMYYIAFYYVYEGDTICKREAITIEPARC